MKPFSDCCVSSYQIHHLVLVVAQAAGEVAAAWGPRVETAGVNSDAMRGEWG